MVKGNLFAQVNHTDTLGEVTIEQLFQKPIAEIKSQFEAGQKVHQIDSLQKVIYNQQSLDKLLAQQTATFIKTMGTNGLATLSLRGASAAQSTVLWNGVPIQNPALGVADISLLNTNLFDQIQLQYGASAALYGSGNVGGALILNDQYLQLSNSKINQFKIGMAYGSFENWQSNAQVKLQRNKWKLNYNAFFQNSKNDLTYYRQQQKERLTNSRLQAVGSNLNFQYKPNVRSLWSGNVWFQHYDRALPPALFERISTKQQEDQSLRTLLHYQYSNNHFYFYSKSSYSREWLNYSDTIANTYSDNVFEQFYQEFGAQYANRSMNGSMHRILVTTPITWSNATTIRNNGHYHQWRPAITANYQFLNPKKTIQLSANLRQEWWNDSTLPLLPGAGAQILIAQQKNWSFSLTGNIQRTYRVPTLNELYYFPGGNQSLLPESGWAQGLGIINTYSRDKWHFSQQTNVYNRNIHNWVYWLGGAIWTPYNIAEVRSYGLETENEANYIPNKDLTLKAIIKTAYNISTVQDSYMPFDNSIGKQTPYTPRYNYQFIVNAQWKRLFLQYQHSYTGYRFVTVDESQYLLPYHLGNVQAMYQIRLRDNQQSLNVTLLVNNIFNERYFIVAQRPTPLRNFQLGVHYQF